MNITGPEATIFGCIITAAVALYIRHKNVVTTAVKDFREAFAPALGRLEAARRHGSTHNVPDVDNFLRDNFEAMATAIHNFAPFVSKARIKAYHQAWDRYCQLAHNQNLEATWNASIICDDDPLSVIEKHIHDILHFAK